MGAERTDWTNPCSEGSGAVWTWHGGRCLRRFSCLCLHYFDSCNNPVASSFDIYVAQNV